ncbi:MAG: hypothetical protein M1561_05630 [Gammaproteobacteria bacterium]|nr:hypothetical protein [Gammaproteobacteria bacterium]
MIKLFPSGIAQGKAFYDRIQEQKKLKQNIDNTIHTALIAPRRFGKTSLMTQVLLENKFDYVWIDFMTITSRKDACNKILQKVGELIVKIAPVTEKLKKITSKYFSALKPEITIKLPGVALNLHPNIQNNDSVIDLLNNLDKLAVDIKKRIVIVFDEFQEILRIDADSTLQASIRHAAERAKKITYLFSGSKHLPLRRMFNGKENPLYALCEIMELSKIPTAEATAFINQEATKKWGSPLDNAVLAQILNYSDRYPKYINALCSAIWLNDKKPKTEIVDELWRSYILSKKTDITENLSELPLNQKKLLQKICQEPITALYKQETLAMLNLSQSSIQKAIDALLEKDFVIEENGAYKALDPTIISYFKMF